MIAGWGRGSGGDLQEGGSKMVHRIPLLLISNNDKGLIH